jgi:glycosyltransferase involved in cell wall biosynthesis
MINVLFVSSFKLERIERLADNLIASGVRMKILDISGQRRLPIILSRILKEPRSTLLMTHENMMVPFSFYLASMIGYKYILIQNGVLWHAWDTEFVFWQRILRHKLLAKILDRSQRVICNSLYLSKEVARYRPSIADRVATIYNAVSPPEKSGDAFDYQEGFTHFLTITNFAYPLKYQGILYLLRALNLAPIPKPSLQVLSKVLTHSGEVNLARFRQEAEQEAGTVKLTFHINEEVGKFLDPDVSFLYCSLPGGDSFPRSVVEMLLSGIPS